MIVATFKVYDNKGMHPFIDHYFVDAYPSMFKKLCAAIGLDFASGDIPASLLVNKSVKVKVSIREDKTGQYGDKNVIAAFSKDFPEGVSGAVASQPVAKQEQTKDEDLPF
jgi:hypothetical protein